MASTGPLAPFLMTGYTPFRIGSTLGYSARVLRAEAKVARKIITSKITKEVENGVNSFKSKDFPNPSSNGRTGKLEKPTDLCSPNWNEWYRQNPNHPEAKFRSVGAAGANDVVEVSKIKPRKGNVSTGAGRDHVTYEGIKDGKPYSGYASAPGGKFGTPEEIIEYRYSDNYSDYGGIAPKPVKGSYGTGIAGKAKARGMCQRSYKTEPFSVKSN